MDILNELSELRAHVHKIQTEVAAVRHPRATDDRLNAAAMELDAIVAATEGATNGILATAEAIGMLADELAKTADPEVADKANRIGDMVAELFTQCSFQDITGQRVAKVVATLQFVEERVEAIIGEIGEKAFDSVPIPDDLPDDADKRLLNGPQNQNKGVSQADIDNMFG